MAGGRQKGFSLIELKVVPMTSATCFHSSSCCSFLSFSSHLSSFLSMVEETFSSTRNTRGSTLSTTKRLSSVQLCHECHDNVITVVFREQIAGVDAAVCHCVSVVVSAFVSWYQYRYFSLFERRREVGLIIIKTADCRRPYSLLAVKCFAKTRTVISYQSGPYFDRISGCDDGQLLKQNSFAWQICTDEIILSCGSWVQLKLQTNIKCTTCGYKSKLPPLHL